MKNSLLKILKKQEEKFNRQKVLSDDEFENSIENEDFFE